MLCAALSAPLAGCAATGQYRSSQDAARAEFVKDASCPADRASVAHPASAPPPDVAADPDRLRIWKAEAEKSRVYSAQGCGQERTYRCEPYGDWPYHYQCWSSRS
jgi:hypothetical protein